MINHYERVPGGNFGDDLNEVFWESIIGQPLETLGGNNTYFLGIGTRLRRKNIPENKKIVVFGAGYGYETIPPKVNSDWDIRCVRGPLTADKLQISQDKVITDPAIMIALLYPSLEKKYKISFIPHHLSIDEDNWKEVCESVNINYIDSTQNPDSVIKEINKSELVITESLHGAIIADSFRIPWIPIYTRSHFSTFKWDDWAASMNLKLKYTYIHPLFNKDVRNKSSFLRYAIRKIYGFSFAKNIAKKELIKCSEISPYLSSDDFFNTRLNEMQLCISKFVEDYG